ncbi:hypothetical protein [Variovorax fucosicus]|uniref:hypothetical protein n=1 Tax=Variovorax fucosicus TaxID=3053517 RepID=UPI002576679E|nr:hypothetical protein [Variovorax sp. J22G47]MDM0056293.1 hypothetical protein [Variovorax sp. J22G47]
MSTVEPVSRVEVELERRRDERAPDVPIGPTKLYTLCGASALATFVLTLAATSTRVDWSLIQAIPGTFWAAVVLASLAFTGVVITNRSTDRRTASQLHQDQSKFELQLFHDADKLTQQLESAADEATIKRETEMRREVYLEAAEELVNAQTGLATLYALDLEADGAMAPLKGYAIAHAKLMVVADSKTTKETMKLSSLFAMALLKAIPEASKARDANTLAEYSKRTAEHYETEWTRLVNEIEKVQDMEALANLTAAHDKFVRWRDDARAIYTNRRELANRAKLEYAYFLRPQLEEIAEQQITVLSRLREELGLDGGELIAQAHARQTREQIYAFLDGLGGRGETSHPGQQPGLS